jgi:hypothetical protein
MEADSISQSGEVGKLTMGRNALVVRNLPTLSIDVTCLGARSSDTPPQGPGGSSRLVGWEPIVLAYSELVVPANLKMTYM